jgi:hypothetical protein
MITAQEAKKIALETLSSKSEETLKKIDFIVRSASSKGEFFADITGLVLVESVKNTLEENGFEIKVAKSDNYIVRQELFWR